ncbi:MAG: hypothetical protein V7742_00935 [Halioglobus sp.]
MPTRFRFLTIALLLITWMSSMSALADDQQATKPVYVSVGILDIDSISSADQSFTINVFVQFRWQDPELAHDGQGSIRKDLSEITAPRFLLLNRQRTWSTLLNVVEIAPSGEAIYRMRLWGDFSQPLSLRDFPFDQHTFNIPILALEQNGGTAELLRDPNADSFMAKELSVADWRITSWDAHKDMIELTPNNLHHGFVFSFDAARIHNHHIIKFIIPLILIVMMSWVVFWIDPKESGSQLSVAVTAALTLIAYHIALAGKLPDIPYLTRMDKFLFGSTLMVFTALLEVVFTSRLAGAGRLRLARSMDRVCAILFPLTFIAIAAYALGLPDMIAGLKPG